MRNKTGLITVLVIIALLLLVGNFCLSPRKNYYGKIIDQNNQPIEGVTVTGTLIWPDFGKLKSGKSYTTLTNKNGEFQFIGFRSWSISIRAQKDGCKIGQGEGVYQAPHNKDKGSPGDRAVRKMWKLKGAEPIIYVVLRGKAPCDGSAIRYDLLTGKNVLEGGDMIVRLTRNPVDIVAGKHFDWSVSLVIPDGGLIEHSDPYPCLAPADGYQTAVKLEMPANMRNWNSSMERNYYFKIRGGKNYGRITVDIDAHFQPPPTPFDAHIFANPAGSRNLEVDPSMLKTVE